MGKLSIVIVNYNSEDFLIKLFDSLTTKTSIPKLWEVIVVDNASKKLPDLKILKKYIPNCKLIFNSKNIGYAAANNKGIKEAKGEYVLLLNPDTKVSKQTIEELVDHLDKHTHIGAITPRINLADGSIDDACHRGFPTPMSALFYFTKLASLFPHSTFFNAYHRGYQNLGIIHEIDSGTGAFLLVRKKVGDKINWFDEKFFWYGDDLDLCYRIKKNEYQIVFYPYQTIMHYKGMSSGIKDTINKSSGATSETKKLAQISRFNAMRIFFKKHYGKKYSPLSMQIILTGIRLLEFFYRAKTKTL